MPGRSPIFEVYARWRAVRSALALARKWKRPICEKWGNSDIKRIATRPAAGLETNPMPLEIRNRKGEIVSSGSRREWFPDELSSYLMVDAGPEKKKSKYS
jgi:hypothetical protein